MVRFQPCAGGVVHDGSGRILLIRRGKAPSRGSWSVPGGRCEDGEQPADACVREVAEETGLAVEVVRRAGRVERDAPSGDVYVIDDFVCRVVGGELVGGELVGGELVGGELVAGDDADEARWVDAAEFERLDLAPGLRDCLREWGLLPR